MPADTELGIWPEFFHIWWTLTCTLKGTRSVPEVYLYSGFTEDVFSLKMAEYYDEDKGNDGEQKKYTTSDCWLCICQKVWHKYGSGGGFQLFYVSATV